MSAIQFELARSIARRTEPWFPEMTGQLVEYEWKSLLSEFGISLGSYSTASVLRARRLTLGGDEILVPFLLMSGDNSQLIEFLPDKIRGRFESNQYKFLTPNEYAIKRVSATLRGAMELIEQTPSLHQSVIQLARCIHILQSSSEENDVSFSDPKLPFSIFVSAPHSDSSSASHRLAEAIVHESMHLQLSLLEKHAPLATTEMATFYSPWKRSDRLASGVLHALYVFAVIDDWLRQFPNCGDKYVSKRRQEIVAQVAEIDAFRNAKLTEFGCTLRDYLFSRF